MKLVPMSPQSFQVFRKDSIERYAQTNIAERGWPAEGALARAERIIDSIAKDGVATPGQNFYDVTDEATGELIGHIMFAMTGEGAERAAYVYEIYIFPEHRRRGHAEAALRAIEPIAREQGAQTMGLHVFASNAGAQALYKKLGFFTTGHNMQKSLAG